MLSHYDLIQDMSRTFMYQIIPAHTKKQPSIIRHCIAFCCPQWNCINQTTAHTVNNCLTN